MYRKILGLLLLLTFFLPACLGRTSEPAPSETATTLSKPPTPLSPTATLASFPTKMPTETLVPLPIKPPPPSEPLRLERIRTIYVEDGNIYLQDGINPPIQLTNSGKDRNPIISEDGEKVVFYRGENYDKVYSINADGSNEQLIINRETLPVLGQGEVKALTFIPDTHTLLFNTYLCNLRPKGPSYDAPDCAVGLYIASTDAGVLGSIFEGLHGNATQQRNFEVSPDGRFLAIASSGGIDIYERGFGVVQQHAVSYFQTHPDEFLPRMYWLPDSSGMIVIVATYKYNDPSTPPHTYAALRYILDENKVVPIVLGATIMFNSGCNFSVSPNRNWILFMGNESGDPREMPLVYLGNLNDGKTQRYEGGSICPSFYYSSPKWSLDSRYFASYGSMNPSRTIGDVEGGPIPFGGELMQWLGASHYIYHTRESKEPLIGELGGESIPVPEGFRWSSTFVIMPLEEEQ